MPCGDNRKPVSQITDRQKRARAQHCVPGPKRCRLCGSTRFLTVDHKDGNESHGSPSNLRWLCKSCNTSVGAYMAAKGAGKRTRQFNPGAKNFAQYAQAVIHHVKGERDAGGKTIHETPKADRSRYAREIARIKHARGTDRPRRRSNADDKPSTAKPLPPPKQRPVYYTQDKSGRYVRFFPTTRRNPSADARAYAEFHGRSPREVLEFQEPLLKSGDYYTLGKLYGLWTAPVHGDPSKWGAPQIEFEESDKVLAVADAHAGGRDRLQIFFAGNGQKIPDDVFAASDLDKQYVELGSCHAIAYNTEKAFDNFKAKAYCHEFGEDTGERPVLYYDRQAKRLLLVGGAYKVAPFDASLGASPGIVN